MRSKKLSIIIPAYNVEDFIEKCITSIQEQGVDSELYEIIIVNDGSTDNSKERILTLMNLYSNIVLVEQENMGVSMARNAGISKAQADHLVFVDADDFIAPDSLLGVLEHARKGLNQLTFLGFHSLEQSTSRTASFQFLDDPEIILSGIEAYKTLMKNVARDPDSSVAVLFQKKFLQENNLKYTGSIPYLEDCEFMARVFCLAKTCAFEKNPFYIRVTRPGSATNSGLFYSDAAVNGFFFAALHLKKFKQLPGLSMLQKDHINQPITKFTLLIVQSCIGQSLSRYREIKKRLRAQQLNITELKGCSSTYYKYGLIYNMSTDLFFGIWSAKLLKMSLKRKFQILVGGKV